MPIAERTSARIANADSSSMLNRGTATLCASTSSMDRMLAGVSDGCTDGTTVRSDRLVGSTLPGVRTIYTPFAQTPFMWLYVMVRTPGSVEPTSRSLRTVVPSVHPSLTPANIRSMDDVLAQSVAVPRFNMLLLSAFAILALVLSAIGIYGVIGYSVAQRTHEIGVRMALGAERVDVLRLVVQEGMVMAAGGVTLGLAGAAMLSQVMTTLLFGITARDPLTFALGGGTLLVVALCASYIPAVRATRVEPITALRAE